MMSGEKECAAGGRCRLRTNAEMWGELSPAGHKANQPQNNEQATPHFSTRHSRLLCSKATRAARTNAEMG
jgi:hypothetical protein